MPEVHLVDLNTGQRRHSSVFVPHVSPRRTNLHSIELDQTLRTRLVQNARTARVTDDRLTNFQLISMPTGSANIFASLDLYWRGATVRGLFCRTHLELKISHTHKNGQTDRSISFQKKRNRTRLLRPWRPRIEPK
mgnify:FL=1